MLDKALIGDIQKRLKDIDRCVKSQLPRQIGIEAVNHYKDNFRKGGFVNGGVNKWADVKRRDPKSAWYGFDYKGEKRSSYSFTRDKKTGKTKKSKTQKKLNWSRTATKYTPLLSRRNELMNSLRYEVSDAVVRITSDKPYAEVHNEGGNIKIFGKKVSRVPQRQFVGYSQELDKKIEILIDNNINKILK